MKKIVNSLILSLLVFSFFISVEATVYPAKVLIPVDTTATVQTELFAYQDFIYNSVLNDKGEAIINFAQISNRTEDKIPISINILLFDVDQKNIGYLTYCTDRDWDSDYNKLKLEGNQSIPFSIKVTSRYFGFKDESKKEKYGAGDVKYIAVLDDNKYCKVGGYDNYIGMTLDKIIGNGVTAKKQSLVKENASLIKNIITVIVGGVFISVGIFVFKFIKEKFSGMSLSVKRSKLDTKNVNGQNNTNNNDLSNNNVPDTGNDVIDLSYHGKVSLDDDSVISVGSSNNSDNINELFNISENDSESANFSDTGSEMNGIDKKSENDDEQKSGESDLANFFK